MQYYIFLTESIHPIGGMQTYVAGKATYLEKEGWTVKVFFSGSSEGECAIESLNKYLSGGIWNLDTPPGKWVKPVWSSILDQMSEQICCNWKDTKIIIESQADTFCLWGELLAARLHAKHVCFVCNERFRDICMHYSEYLDFYDFKHQRKELACIHERAMCKLFEGYKEVEPEKRYTFNAALECPVQDVKNCKVEQLKKYDWNICHIGRSKKPYVPKVIRDISYFAQKYPDKKIQFIMVGDVEFVKELLEEVIHPIKNIKLSLIGNAVPIPRTLFKKIDVVIATSGCASYAARENVPTIVADVGNGLANGIYGYTAFDNLFHDKNSEQTDYVTALEKVLIEKEYKNMKFSLPEILPASYYYEKHFEFIKQSNRDNEYYDKILSFVSIDYKEAIKYYLGKYFPLGLIICQNIKRLFKLRLKHRDL